MTAISGTPNVRCAESISQDGTLLDSVGTSSIAHATPTRLLSLLNVYHLTHIDDQSYIIRQGRASDQQSLARAASMVKRTEFQRWLNEPHSAVILVEACGSRLEAGRVPAISHVCAVLEQALRTHGNHAVDEFQHCDGSTTLLFFCGRHMERDDPLRGPQGLMRSLLAQLIMALVRNRWISDSAAISVPFSEAFHNKSAHTYADEDIMDTDLDGLPPEDACLLFKQLLVGVAECSPCVPSGQVIL